MVRFLNLFLVHLIKSFSGVTRTHKLYISVPAIVLGPRMVEDSVEISKLRARPGAIKEILDHFSIGGTGVGKGKVKDLQLIWEFGLSKVKVKSAEVGKGWGLNELCIVCIFWSCLQGSDYLSTELDVDFREFEGYEVLEPPITIAFQLREFSVSRLDLW